MILEKINNFHHYIEGEVLVVLNAPRIHRQKIGKEEYKRKIHDSSTKFSRYRKANLKHIYEEIANHDGKNVIHIQDSTKTTEELIKELKNLNGVYSVEPNYIIQAKNITPNDTHYSYLWGLETINANKAWTKTTGNKNVIVAVYDSGIDYTHEDLASNITLDYYNRLGRNSINNTYDPMDDHGHGTHVAGIIGAVGNNSKGVTGVAWNVGLLGVKILDEEGVGTYAQLLDGINYILEQKQLGLNINVVNMSVGGWMSPTILTNPINSYYVAYKALLDNDILIVAAAGNECQDISNPGGTGSNKYDTTQSYTGLLPYPASFSKIFNNCVTVASMNEDFTLSDFSNYGPEYVQIASPGYDIGSTYLDDRYVVMDGTSMAAPYVAGAAALVYSLYPNKSAIDVKNLLLDCVIEKSELTTKVSTNGYLNIYDALVNVWDKKANIKNARINHSIIKTHTNDILIIGGYNDSVIKKCEKYNITNNTWTDIKDMYIERMSHTNHLLTNNDIIIIGGYGKNNEILKSCEIYNLQYNKWYVPAELNYARVNHQSILLDNSNVLVVGGYNNKYGILNFCEIYNVTTNQWTIVTPMNYKRMNHKIVKLNDGRILVVGGYGSLTNENNMGLNTCEIYDSSNNTWTVVNNMNKERINHSMLCLSDNRVLVFGGSFGHTMISEIEEYNVEQNMWSIINNLQQPRELHDSLLLDNEHVLISYGRSFDQYLSQAEKYNIVTNEFVPIRDSYSSRLHSIPILLDNSKILITGGYDNDNTFLTTTEIYNP